MYYFFKLIVVSKSYTVTENVILVLVFLNQNFQIKKKIPILAKKNFEYFLANKVITSTKSNDGKNITV